MIRRRYRFPLVSLLLLALILSACGQTGSGGNTNTNNPTPGATTPAGQSTLPPGATPAGQGAPPEATTAGSAGSPASAATQPPGGTGMIDHLDFGGFGGGDNPQVNYNPFSPNALSFNYTFEPLLALDSFGCKITPWLATDYKWQDPQTLVFTIRDGVKWNDGQPFSADDVVYTFNLLKQQPAFDSQGVWAALDSVSGSGNQVTFKFKQPSVNMLNKVGNGVLIVPKHVWEKESNPVKFTNPDAVGTGPFKPTSFNGQELVLSRVDSYWQVDKIHVQKLIFHKNAGGNEVEQLKLSQGAYDTNAMFVPDIAKVYVNRDPAHNHYWYPPGGLISLGFNLTKAPFNDPQFRKAVAYAINRDAIKTKAEYGYVTAASQTGLVLPGQKDWLDPSIPNQGLIPYDPKQAADILTKAGYKKDGNGKLLGKDGQPIQFTFLVQNGWTDWVAAAQVVQQSLNALGLTVNVQTPSPDTITQQTAAGNFDMAFAVPGGDCSLYTDYYNYYDSAATAPVGQSAATNWIRYQDPQTDKLIAQLRQSTDPAAQKQAAYGLEKVLVDQMPTVALWYGAHWFQYSTKNAVGWPDQYNPYAGPTDNLLIITHLLPSPDYKNGQ